MSNLKPSDVDEIVKELDAVAQSKAKIPAGATAMQKFAAFYGPMAKDEGLSRSQSQWYLGSCVGRTVEEVTKGMDPKLAAQETTAIIRQFAQLVGEAPLKLRVLFQVYAAYRISGGRKADLGWDYHRLVLQRVKDATPEVRLQWLTRAQDSQLPLGVLQKLITKAQKTNQDEGARLKELVTRAEALLARRQAAYNRYLQSHGTPVEEGELVAA
jgi:hypothetical protein